MKGGLIVGNEYIKRLSLYEIENLQRRHQVIKEWDYSFKEKGLNYSSEQSLKTDFLTQIFQEVLGYEGITRADLWTMEVEKRTEKDATTPDAVLGFFQNGIRQVKAVVEIKKPSVNLDMRQNRKDTASPVNQAFSYQHKHHHCKWVIVTNIKEIRLYSKDSSLYYESFCIHEMAEDVLLFEKFCFLLSKENLIGAKVSSNASNTSDLYSSSASFRETMEHAAAKAAQERDPLEKLEEEKRKLRREQKNKEGIVFLKQLENAEYTLGEFVSSSHGFNIPKTKLTAISDTSDFCLYHLGSFERYEPFTNFQYFDANELEGTTVNESYFHGPRILVKRYDENWNKRKISPIQANLTEESFFHSKKYLVLLIKDNRLTPEYLLALLNSRLIKKWYLENRRVGNLADNNQVTPIDLKKIPIVVPPVDELRTITLRVREWMQIKQKVYIEQERFLDTLPNKYRFLEEHLRNKKIPVGPFIDAMKSKVSFNEQIDLTEIEQSWHYIGRQFYPKQKNKFFDFDLYFARIYNLDVASTKFIYGLPKNPINAKEV